MSWKIIIIICLNIVAAIVSFSTSEGVFPKKPDQPRQIFGRKRRSPLTKKGLLLAFAFIATTLMSVWQYKEDESDKATKELETRLATAVRDSLDSVSIHRSDSAATAEIIKGKNETIEALARYNLKQDSTSGVIVTYLRDSARKITVKGPVPDFGFCLPDGIKLQEIRDGDHIFELSFCSVDAPTTGFDVKLHIIAEDEIGYINTRTRTGTTLLFPNSMKVPVHTSVSKKTTVHWLSNLNYFHFALVGTYQNISRTETYTIELIHTYDVKQKKQIALTGAPFERIKAYIHKLT